MKELILTELNLVSRLHKSGMLNYFNNDELIFYMTDLCFGARTQSFNTDIHSAKKMVDNGKLLVVKSDQGQLGAIVNLYKIYKPAFTLKTVSALNLARDLGRRLVTEDAALKDVALRDFGVGAVTKDQLIIELAHELVGMGMAVDVELLRQLV